MVVVSTIPATAFATCIIRAHGRRIASGDIEALPDLLDLADELNAATQHAVNGLRPFGYCWTDIAVRLGTPGKPPTSGEDGNDCLVDVSGGALALAAVGRSLVIGS